MNKCLLYLYMLNLIKKIVLFLIPNSFIKRRHFHSSTYHKDNFFVMTIFNNNFCRNLLFKFANLFKSFSKSNSIFYRLFVYQSVKKENFNNKSKYLYEIDYGRETRKAILISTNEKINLDYEVSNNQYIWFGVILLENYFYLFNINKHDLEIKITIKNKNKNKIINLVFPTDDKKHGIAHIDKGDSWIDISLNLEDFSNSRVEIIFEFAIVNRSFLMFPKKKDPSNNVKKLITDSKGIAISSPIPYFKNKVVQKILYISCESLTDPFWLEKINYSKKIEFKNIKEIISDSTYYKKSYSVADSTMPNIASVLSGLSPLQHGFGDYNNSIHNSQFNEKIIFLPEILKKKKFTCAAYTVYERFDPLYGFSKGFDLWSQVNNTYDTSAPSANKITNALNFFKDHNLFLYCHLNRLHGPMLNNGTIESPSMFSAESISDGINYNFNDLYTDRLKVLDNELGIIINYLKFNNMYDNTTLIITGDHGAALPPKWKMNELKFPLYEHHSRVPLIIKHNKLIGNHEPQTVNYPVSSQLISFMEILKSQNLNIPDYFKDLFQSRMIDIKSALSEVIYHPMKNNYGISLVTENSKIFKLYEVDWERHVVQKVIIEKVFKINSDGKVIDEDSMSNEKINDYENLSYQLNKIIDENFKFLKNYSHTKLPNTVKKVL